MTLGGVTFVRNGWQYDYCFREAIVCLQELCDQVVVLDAGSDDTTNITVKQYEDQNTMVICFDKLEWERQRGRTKLAHFQNLAKSFLDTDYYVLLQADEIIHEKSFPAIKCAIHGGAESYLVSRINLWRDCNSYISVPDYRQPCSTKVIRIAKTKYDSVDDGESISAQASDEFIDDIKIYHYGFVRRKDVMKKKIINMQEGVFEIDHDPKLDSMDEFDWRAWFYEDDLRPLKGEHPKFIKNWIKTRP